VVEAPGQHLFIHGYVPNASTLLHSVKSMLNDPHPVLFARLFELEGLFHILILGVICKGRQFLC